MERSRWLLPLLTFAVFSFEIAITRIFGYLFSYELTPVAVAVALFGLGTGAWLRQSFLAGPEAPALLPWGLLLLGGSLVSVYLILLLTASPVGLVACTALVFVVCGILISSLYEGWGAGAANLAYSLDLGGGALGCLAVVPLLNGVGPLGVLFFLVCLVTLGAAFLAWARPRRRRGMFAGAATASCLLLGMSWTGALPDALLISGLGAGKPLKTFLRQGGRVVDHAWSLIGRADIYEPPETGSAKLIFSDGDNPSVMVQEPLTPAEVRAARRKLQYLPIALSRPHRMLILGSGGGVEIALAKVGGVQQADAVELNPAIVDLVRKWRGFAGPVYDQPGVKVFVAEGRRFLATHPVRYDLIQMTLVLADSTEYGTYNLPDGYLYTREAYRLYLDRLRPDGVLAVIDDAERRMTKHFMTALAAVQEREGETTEALRHLMVLQSSGDDAYRYLLLVSPKPFSAATLQSVLIRMVQSGFQPLWMPGGMRPQEPYASIVREGTQRFIAASPLDMEARSDDSPYPFHFAKGLRATLGSFRYLLSIAAASVILAIIVVWRSGRDFRTRAAAMLGCSLGLGFMVLQIGLLQRLTLAAGGPSQTLAVLLFSFLLWCGLGSRLAGAITSRWGVGIASYCALAGVLGILTALTVNGTWILARVDNSLVRGLCVVLALAPVGVALGMPFPTLLRTWGARGPKLLGTLWGLSGLAGVTGTVVAMMGSPVLGIQETVLLASTLYLAIGLMAR